ncbi:MAG TPA: GxxExxY protein [Flavobacteriales bacterium]|jgi:GxxExxY protein|nr:GxxExxY protein [Flavobacteriales bacterium]
MTLLYKQESYKIQGAIFEVYKEIGTGYLEAIYQESLEKELALSDILYQAQKELTIHYKGVSLKQTYKPDLICYNNIIIELKAVKEIAPEHQAQILNYMKATNIKLGLLVNFCSHPKVTIKRFIL